MRDKKVLIKVGTSCNIILHGIKAYRAISYSHAYKMIDKYDIDICIIDGVSEWDIDNATNFINYTKEKNKKVVVYSDCGKVGLGIDGLIVANTLDELTNIIKNNVDICSTEVVETLVESNETLSKDDLDIYTSINRLNNELPIIENKGDLQGILGEPYEDLYSNDSSTIDKYEEYKEKATSEIVALLNTKIKDIEYLKDQLNQANDRISILLNVKESLEDERDMYKNMLKDIESNGEVVEEEELNVCNTESIKAELEEYKVKLKESEDNKAILIENISKLNDIIESYKKELEAIELDRQRCINQINDIRNNKEESHELVVESLSKKIEVYEEVNKKIQAELEKEKQRRIVVTNMLNGAIKNVKELKDLIKIKDKEIEMAGSSIKYLRDSLDNRDKEFQQIEKKYNELSNLYSNGYQGIGTEFNKIREDLEIANQKIDIYKAELESMSKILKDKQNEITALKSMSGKEETVKLIGANKVLEESNKGLLKELMEVKRELEVLRARANTPEGNSSNIIMDMENIKLECEYTGKAMVIPVYGSGSYGITTTAMSIVRKINTGKVLFMDMDIHNPTADSWFARPPIITELQGLADPLNKTGFGALLERGAEYVIENSKYIFQRVEDIKSGYIDYFSGVYKYVNPIKIQGINFTKLMNYLGEQYNYIIVDLGRYGSSEIGNALIKMFDSIAYKSVIVTLKNKFNVRSLGVKVANDKLNLGNTIWVLNISDDTKVEPLIVKSIGNAKTVIMPKVMQMYGTGQTFDRVPVARDKMIEIMELLFS